MIVGPCPSSDQLTEYALGTLSSELAQEMESHIEQCSQCVETMALLETQTDLLTGLLRSQPEPHEALYLEEEDWLRAVASVSDLSLTGVHGGLAPQVPADGGHRFPAALQPGQRLGQ